MIRHRFALISFCIIGLLFPLFSAWAGTIVGSHKYAWSNNAGYINFGNVTVNDSALSGYAWSANKGFINFSPNAGGVVNDGAGNLSGFAWGEGLGWIDFDNVRIGADGKFSGTASGALIGTLTFDCPNYCDVETDWRPSVSTPASSVPVAGGVTPPLMEPGEQKIIPAEAPQTETPPGTGAVTSAVPSAEAPDSSSPPSTATENVPLFDVISEPADARVDTASAGLTVKVAPGELLPISVKLANFGGGKRVDVLVKYAVFSSDGKEVYSTSETVAVETTANFVKTIQIPFDTPPGRYIARTSIVYGGQLVPATTEFPFTVERKILGLFESEFFLYGGITLGITLVAGIFGYSFVRRQRRGRYDPIDYSDVPKDERVFYELISDTVMGMRQKVGDEALDIASGVDGLVIDEKTGRVLKLTRSPSKVVADLVSEYEKALGKKVSFSFRKN